MDKDKLGKKLLCPECEVKFYDLGKPEIICPSCGFNISNLIKEHLKIEEKSEKTEVTPPTEKQEVSDSSNDEDSSEENPIDEEDDDKITSDSLIEST